MLIGGGIALVLVIMFLVGAEKPNPEWPKLWMIKPLILVPLAGALGGGFYYFMSHALHQGGWQKILAVLLGLIGYIIALWLGTVLGFNGTYWN